MPANKKDAIRKSWRQATKLVREGTQRSGWFETSEALYLNSGFVYDDATDSSVLVILDASDLSKPPVARVHLPQRVPFGFHGSWIDDSVMN